MPREISTCVSVFRCMYGSSELTLSMSIIRGPRVGLIKSYRATLSESEGRIVIIQFTPLSYVYMHLNEHMVN